MCKIIWLLFTAIFLLFPLCPTGIGMAGEIIEFKYAFTDKFDNSIHLLPAVNDQNVEQIKDAVQQATKIWENATQANIRFYLVDDQEKADIIFEGWSEAGPKLSSRNGRVCIDDYDGKPLFAEYMPEALGFTIFEDCNTACEYPETCDPANAANNHRARIYFKATEKAEGSAAWFYTAAANSVSFDAAQRDVTRVAAQEIGHALGFCGFPDNAAQNCPGSLACGRDNASIMCKNQVHCYRKDQNGDIPLGGMDDIDNMGVRDLTLFDKKRIVKKFFSNTKTLYGRVKDADGKPIPNAVIATADENLTARTDSQGRYALWRVPPGTYSENGKNPETDQIIGETITITPAAPEIIAKDFNFIRSSQKILTSGRIIPPSGTPQDVYNLEATFPGIYPHHSAAIRLYIDGQVLHTFSTPPADEQPVIVYSYYSLSDLGLGSHMYELKASKQEQDWRPFVSGTFMIKSPSHLQFHMAAEPTHISIGENESVSLHTRLANEKGVPMAGETVRFRSSFPGYFAPSSGEVKTNAHGQADITFTPMAAGLATITATPPYGPSASEAITCTSPVANIAFEFRRVGDNAYAVTAEVDYSSGEKSAAGDTVKWRLQPAANLAWTKGPYTKLDKSGKARGIFSINNPDTTRATVTVTHTPTGVSSSSIFIPTSGDAVRMLPWKNLNNGTNLCEWSPNGYLGIIQKFGSKLSIYRLSDWRRIFSKTAKGGKYSCFHFAPDGQKAVLGLLGGESKITVLNVPSGRIDKSWRISIDGESYGVDKSIGWQGDYLFAAHTDDSVRKWSISGQLEAAFKHNAEIEELRFSPLNDSQFAAVDKSGILKIWRSDNGTPVKTVQVESMPTGRLKCVAWSHDGTSISVGSGIGNMGIIYTFDTSSWSKSGFDLPGLGNVNSLDYNSDSSLLAIGHDKGLTVYNTHKQSIEYYDKGSVQHVRWGPKKSMLAADGRIYLLGKQSFEFPEIRLLSPPNQSSFMGEAAEISGKVIGHHNLKSANISVDDQNPLPLSLASNGSFTHAAPLANRQNKVIIQAQDVQQNTTSLAFTVNRLADSIPPLLTEAYVDTEAVAKEKSFTFSVRPHDGESGIDASKVSAEIRRKSGGLLSTVKLYDDGSHGDNQPGDGVYEAYWVPAEAIEGLFSVDFVAFDRAENVARLSHARHFYTYDPPTIQKPGLTPISPSMNDNVVIDCKVTDTSGVKSVNLLYSADNGSSWNPVSMLNNGPVYSATIPAQTSKTVYYRMTAVDVHGYGNESSVYAYRVHDNTRPVVIIQEPATISKTVTSKPSIAISGHTIDAGNAGLKSITCNTGEPNLGTLEHWSFDVSLHHGANEIIIIAEDKNGKLGSDTIEITRALQPEPPGFSPAAPLSFENQLTVSISTAEKNMVIHYTTDGTEPTAASKIYSSPILIKETTTFKAKSFTEDGMPSPVSVATYTLVPKKKADVHKHLTLQVAAFKDKAFADDLVSTLKAKGYPAYSVVGTSPENVTYYKVRLGFFGERVDAENMLEKMKEENLKAIIVNTTVSE